MVVANFDSSLKQFSQLQEDRHFHECNLTKDLDLTPSRH